ncbi:hypothetical protein H2201_006943 [Coniosporium apollinis]|uniref:Uncharacterized protein n=1 Tax=Coniosporium apollinis TaxID=61459 RepID=A0ABQ9NKB1_9PEZI|nr:hypothetical protein H2201_006943 [Coniosporium apollinis]
MAEPVLEPAAEPVADPVVEPVPEPVPEPVGGPEVLWWQQFYLDERLRAIDGPDYLRCMYIIPQWRSRILDWSHVYVRRDNRRHRRFGLLEVRKENEVWLHDVTLRRPEDEVERVGDPENVERNLGLMREFLDTGRVTRLDALDTFDFYSCVFIVREFRRDLASGQLTHDPLRGFTVTESAGSIWLQPGFMMQGLQALDPETYPQDNSRLNLQASLLDETTISRITEFLDTGRLQLSDGLVFIGVRDPFGAQLDADATAFAAQTAAEWRAAARNAVREGVEARWGFGEVVILVVLMVLVVLVALVVLVGSEPLSGFDRIQGDGVVSLTSNSLTIVSRDVVSVMVLASDLDDLEIDLIHEFLDNGRVLLESDFTFVSIRGTRRAAARTPVFQDPTNQEYQDEMRRQEEDIFRAGNYRSADSGSGAPAEGAEDDKADPKPVSQNQSPA